MVIPLVAKNRWTSARASLQVSSSPRSALQSKHDIFCKEVRNHAKALSGKLASLAWSDGSGRGHGRNSALASNCDESELPELDQGT